MYKPPKTSLALPIFWMVGPTASIVLAFVLGSIGWSLPAVQTTGSNLLGDQSSAAQTLNIFAFLFGGFGIAAIIPGFIAGIAILERRKKARRIVVAGR